MGRETSRDSTESMFSFARRYAKEGRGRRSTGNRRHKGCQRNPINTARRNSIACRLQILPLLVLACALLLLVGATTAAESGEGQSGRSRVSEDQLNAALSDKRYLARQLKCALGEAPCDPVGRRLKSLVPLVLRGSCPQCSAEETRQIKKVLSHIQRSFPKEWNRIVQQYAGVS